MEKTHLKACLWIVRAWMVLVLLSLPVTIYLLFFADPAIFAADSMTPESPLSQKMWSIGFLIFLFLFGLGQSFIIRRQLAKLD